MSQARYLIGDVFDRLAELPDGSIDLVLTSPPFLALRSYLPADHPDKGKEIGSEPTPAAFLDTLLHLTAEWRRVLAPHGSICVELGDTYAGSGGAGGDYAEGGMHAGQPKFRQQPPNTSHRLHPDGSVKTSAVARAAETKNQPRTLPMNGGPGWPLSKSLCGIPHLYHLSLAYGRNLLTGEPSPAGQWRVRNVVAWCRPNPPVGALGDKFRPATSYMTIATVARDRYFDLNAVRSDPSEVKDQRYRTTNGPKNHADPAEVLTANYTQRVPSNPAGAPPLDWWEIPTQPYSGSHYASFPMALCTKPIRSMCPLKVCTVCGEPSLRVVEVERITPADDRQRKVKADEYRRNGHNQAPEIGWEFRRETTGWTDCGHDSWRTGIVLDPFGGSGTTAAVGTGEGRNCVLIDIDERNAELARARVGMFLDISYESGDPLPDWLVSPQTRGGVREGA